MIALLLLFAAAPFSHKPHVEVAKLVCADCHKAPEKFGAEVGYPTAAKCAICHGERERGREIPAVRAVKLPGFVYFDHRMHLVNGVVCTDCHGAEAGNAAVVTMKFCQACHVKMRAAAGCGTCHDPR